MNRPYHATVPFTPGPWRACCIDDDYERKCHCGYIFTRNGAETIARVHHNDPKLPGEYERMEDTVLLATKNANACLIAAAPEMHAALLLAKRALSTKVGWDRALIAIEAALVSAQTMDLGKGGVNVA